MKIEEIKYNDEFKVNYNGVIVQISSTVYENQKVYRLYWPDDTIDFISEIELDGDFQWRFNTMALNKQKDFRLLIKAKQN